MTLKACACASSAVIALIICWFGFDGTRGGIAGGSALVAFSGFVFFGYGLTSLLLLIRAWVTGARSAWRLLALLATVPFAFLFVASLGKDGINSREAVALVEVAVLLVLNVISVRFVARGSASSRLGA